MKLRSTAPDTNKTREIEMAILEKATMTFVTVAAQILIVATVLI